MGAIGALLYSLRGAEALAMVAALGTILWGFTILVPEYCLAIWSDANLLGTPLVGMLVILISVIPAVLLLPLILIYLLQYLGRVLLSSASGETLPPRLPDRNFEGLFHGLTPWVLWLVLGGAAGLLPCGFLMFAGGRSFSDYPILAVALPVLGVPYALVALMLAFLHDRPLACAPPGVLWALLAHGASLLPALLRASALLGVGAGTLLAVLSLRASSYWVYVPTALAWWLLAVWIAIAEMRLLGLHYFRRQDSLKWHRTHPRWGSQWRL
jgi:hypothetical protein